jgi:polysaccharide biosynthesis transport protein
MANRPVPSIELKHRLSRRPAWGDFATPNGYAFMQDFPELPRARPRSVLTPLIPLDYVHPGISLSQMFSLVRAYRGLILLIMFSVLSITGLAMALWPRTYVATVTMMVNYEVNDPLNGKELPIGQVANYISTQVELMQTQEVLLAVVDRLQLTQDSDYLKGYRDGRGNVREWVAAKVAKYLTVNQSQRGSQLIYITYSADHPGHAAEVANTVAEVYKEHDEMRSTAPPGERAKRYALQLNELKGKVDEAQRGVTAFHQRNGLIEEGNKTNVDLELLATLEARLVDAQNTRRYADARAGANQSVSDQVLASPQTQALKTQLAAQELRHAQLERVYFPQHPDILDSQLQLASTRRSIDSALKSYSDNASASQNVAQRLENSLRHEVDTQRRKVLAKGRLQDESAKYLLALESAQSVYKRALEGYDQIMFASTRPYTNVSLVSRATPPVKPKKPMVLTGIIFGSFLAIMLGFAIPLVYELLNRRVRCRDDIEREHGIAVLAEFGPISRRALA